MSAKTEKKIRKIYNRRLDAVAGRDFDLYHRLMTRSIARYRVAVVLLSVSTVVAVALGVVL